jgi:N-acetylglucosamine kinase
MAEQGMPMQCWYGIDVGGTKIELVAYDATLRELHRERVTTPTQDYDTFLQAITGLVHSADRTLGGACRAIGIGLPGVRDRSTGRQLSANVPSLTGHLVGEDLQARLQRPLQFGNDLQCFALSEAHGGAGEGYRSMFGAILGTGAGGGFCVGGQLLTGANGIAGEWGHWSIPATLLQRHALPVLPCACGLRGCLERYVSGNGLALIHEGRAGDAVDATAVVALAHAGDAIAMQALDIHRDLLGYSFANLILAIDPHVIVLGGGLSKLEQLYHDLPAAIIPYLFQGVRVPPILPPTFGDAGGARGAALLARQHHPAC